MAAAVPYDAMEEKAEPSDNPEEESAESDPAEDDEFMMAAEEAGFTGEKAKALWRAVDRCVQLSQSGPVPMMGDEE